MKRIFISLLLLLLTLSVVSCSAAKESEELDFSLAGDVAEKGTIAFETETDIFEDKDVEITVKYGFYRSKFEHNETVREYKIVFYNEAEQYTVYHTDGYYDANDFILKGNGFDEEYEYPKAEKVVLPKAFFREGHGEINIKIYGTEGDGLAESLLASSFPMYYQCMGNAIAVSDIEHPIKLEHLLKFEYKTNKYGISSVNTDDANERYAPSFGDSIYRRYPIDCLVAWEHSTDITFNDESHTSKSIVVGSRVNNKKIRLCFYSIDEDTNLSRLVGTVTLKYSGDYSIDYCSEKRGVNACLFLYLWDDNTVLTFGDPHFNISPFTENITVAATIRDNAENAKIREEIEARSDVETAKSLGEFEIRAIEKNGKYKMIVAESENGEDIEVYKNSFIGSLLEAIVGFFTNLF